MQQNLDFFSVYSSVYRTFTNQINHILEKYDLSSSYWRVLRIIEKTETKVLGEITNELYIEKPALTKIIKKLSEMGIVEIQRGQDKREKNVRLTRLGKEKVAEIRKELKPFLEKTLDGLTQEQLNSTIEVLQHIQKNITRW